MVTRLIFPWNWNIFDIYYKLEKFTLTMLWGQGGWLCWHSSPGPWRCLQSWWRGDWWGPASLWAGRWWWHCLFSAWPGWCQQRSQSFPPGPCHSAPETGKNTEEDQWVLRNVKVKGLYKKRKYIPAYLVKSAFSSNSSSDTFSFILHIWVSKGYQW